MQTKQELLKFWPCDKCGSYDFVYRENKEDPRKSDVFCHKCNDFKLVKDFELSTFDK